MLKCFTYRRARHSIISCFLACSTAFLPQFTYAQTLVEGSVVDPGLEELVQTIKSRVDAPPRVTLRQPPRLLQDELNLDLFKQMQTASFSGVPQTILYNVAEFKQRYKPNGSQGLSRIAALYTDYAHGLEDGLTPKALQDVIQKYTETGNWFEKYAALDLLSYLHAANQDRQGALKKAQLALSLVSDSSDKNIYSEFAKIEITSFIAHLHNLQGNSSLALSTSLEYLKLTENDPNPEAEIDLINNLIYAYGVGRNHEAQLFLSEHLLELEKTRSSTVPGLSAIRIAGSMNDVGRFNDALAYAAKANEKAENPAIIRKGQMAEAIALSGLGRFAEARRVAQKANVNFARDNMLKVETRKEDLYLAFLFAQKEDPAYATQLFNRQLDVTAQSFLLSNSRDTTTMLAELENSRERQAERDAASAREADLQALTIDRQRKLNQALIFLIFLMGSVAMAAICFARYRSRMASELQIKTEEAASAEKLKTDFLGMISHELRTPLNGIIGISDLLANYHEDPDIRKKTGIVLRSGTELLAVVESLTDMARLDAGQFQLLPHDADLSISLTAVAKPWAEEAKRKGLKLTAFVDAAIGQHHIDEKRLLQCINIILANAVSFTDSGRVHLHITANHNAQNEVDGLTAVVADTGQGMSKLVQSRLFTPFMQADTSRKRTHMGTGLSLAIAYATIEMMGGKLSVSSREGRGSEFKFHLPLQPAEAPSIPASAERVESLPKTEPAPSESRPTSFSDTPFIHSISAPPREFVDLMSPPMGARGLHEAAPDLPKRQSTDQLNILIVDDKPANRDTVRLILEMDGHNCSEASDGFSALTKLDQRFFDLMILDIHMAPMDGIETLGKLRRSQKPFAAIPVIALTADTAANTNAACMEAGADLFLTKPIQRDELVQAIYYLNRAASARVVAQ